MEQQPAEDSSFRGRPSVLPELPVCRMAMDDRPSVPVRDSTRSGADEEEQETEIQPMISPVEELYVTTIPLFESCDMMAAMDDRPSIPVPVQDVSIELIQRLEEPVMEIEPLVLQRPSGDVTDNNNTPQTDDGEEHETEIQQMMSPVDDDDVYQTRMMAAMDDRPSIPVLRELLTESIHVEEPVMKIQP